MKSLGTKDGKDKMLVNEKLRKAAKESKCYFLEMKNKDPKERKDRQQIKDRSYD